MRTQLELSNDIASELAGPGDAIMRTLEGHLDADLFLRGNVLTLDGEPDAVQTAEAVVRELSDLGGAMNADPDEFARLRERYALEMQPESVPELVQRFGLRVGQPLSGGWVPA